MSATIPLMGRSRVQLASAYAYVVLDPVYNEAATLEQLLTRAFRLELDKQLIVIDDGSTDASSMILERWVARHPDTLVLHKPNAGKGSALRAAIRYITGEIAVIQDADLEYDPADVPRLIEPIQRGDADVVFGTRTTGGQTQLFWQHVANEALSLLADVLFHTRLSDIETGYKAFRADVLATLDLREDGFGIEPEITAAVCRRDLRISQLPVSYQARGYDAGKKISWRDGLAALRILLQARLPMIPIAPAHSHPTLSHSPAPPPQQEHAPRGPPLKPLWAGCREHPISPQLGRRKPA